VIFVASRTTETRHFGGVFMICSISTTYAASIGVQLNSLFAYLSKSALGCWKLDGKKHSKPCKRSSTCLATQPAQMGLALHIARI
jgi:hypothetical protein